MTKHRVLGVVVAAIAVMTGVQPVAFADKFPCPQPDEVGAQYHGSLTPQMVGDDRVVDFDLTAWSQGYYITTDNGNVFAFGDAHWFGSMAPTALGDQRVIELVPLHSRSTTDKCDSSFAGYLLVTDHGRVYRFGDVRACGSIASEDLGDQRVVAFEPHWGHFSLEEGLTSTRSAGKCGYRFLTDRGNVYAFGFATWCGSVPGETVDGDRAIAIADAGGRGCGYRVFTEQGHVYAFRRAPYLGSIEPATLGHQQIVAVHSDETYSLQDELVAYGYTLFSDSGNAYTFGTYAWPGSLPQGGQGIVDVFADPPFQRKPGYLLFGQQGAVYRLGCADFDGSAAGLLPTGERVVATGHPGGFDVPGPGGPDGYYLVTDRGHVYAFNDGAGRECRH